MLQQTSSQTQFKSNTVKTMLLVVGIVLIASTLRAPITGIAPVLDQVIAHFKLTASQAGMLTTLPLIAFAVASPLAAMLAKRLGLEISLLIALICIGLGCFSRLFNFQSILFIGTGVIGVGIAIGNVLLPSLIKRDFPQKVAIMTSVYVLAMGIVGGGFSAIVIPLAEFNQFGWQVALALFSILVIMAILFWLPQLTDKTQPTQNLMQTKTNSKIWHYALAWQVTLYLGCNSLFTYIMVGWLPGILIESGHSAEQAGVLHGAFLIATAIPGLVLVPLLAKLKDQRLPAVSIALLAAISSLSLFYFPDLAFLFTLIVGFCSGACFILGLSFISYRTQNSQQAAALSGMGQCFGYTLAATGPMLAGFLHTQIGDWSGAVWLCATGNLICATVGFWCGRDTQLPA